jgi:hypothetical protein
MDDIEKSAGPGASHHDLAGSFRAAWEGATEEDPRKKHLLWEMWLHDLMLTDPGDYRDQWGPLAPIMVMASQVYPPPVKEFPHEAEEYFIARLGTAKTPTARARLHDFLRLRRREVDHANRAIEAYVAAASSLADDDEHQNVACEYLERADTLARELRQHRPELVDALFQALDRLVARDRLGLACRLVRHHPSRLASMEGRGREVLQQLTDAANRFASRGGQDRSMERSLLDACSSLAGALGEDAMRDELRERIPRSFEAEAKERESDGGLVQLALLQDALKLYSNLGMAADVERAKSRIDTATERAASEMKTVNATASIPTEQIRDDVDRMLDAGAKHGESAHLLGLACNGSLWPNWETVSKEARDLREQYPMRSLVRSSLIGPEGVIVPAPEAEDKRRLFDEIRHFSNRLRYQLVYVSLLVEELRHRNAWSLGLLVQALANGSLFSEKEIKAIRPGLQLFEEGRYWEATHVLSPSWSELYANSLASWELKYRGMTLQPAKSGGLH